VRKADLTARSLSSMSRLYEILDVSQHYRPPLPVTGISVPYLRDCSSILLGVMRELVPLFGLLYQPRMMMDDDQCGAISGMISRGS
jgi:hypothetical protein